MTTRTSARRASAAIIDSAQRWGEADRAMTSQPMVRVVRVYCPQCGAYARQWHTRGRDVRLPAVLPMAEVREFLNGARSKRAHNSCRQQLFAELEPVSR